MTCGIYLIVNLVNNKFYIGSAINCKDRWKNHKYLLKANKHSNTYLQNTYNKYGADNIGYSILEETLEENRIQREQFWLDYTRCYDPKIGYNVCKIAGVTTGYKHTEETMKLLIGKKHTEESKAKIAEAGHNRIKTEEEIKKTADKLRGQKRTLEQRIKMSAAQRGRKHSDETRKRMSEVRKGNFTKEHIDKVKEALKGNQFNRNLDRWPCPDGWKCKCRPCRQRNYEFQKARLAKSN